MKDNSDKTKDGKDVEVVVQKEDLGSPLKKEHLLTFSQKMGV